MTRGAHLFPSLLAVAITWSCQMPKNQILLLNAEMMQASVAISCDDRQTWRPVAIGAYGRERYQCDLPGQKMWMHINTDLSGKAHQELEQQLKTGERYEIYFDTVARKWNIRLAVASASR